MPKHKFNLNLSLNPLKLFKLNRQNLPEQFTLKQSATYGFTLIELLVAITIISVMFGVVISSSGALRQTSSDAKKKADLAQIQSALQNYYADLNYFPRSSGSGAFVLNGANPSTTLTSQTGLINPPPNPLPSLKTYLKEVPIDPVTPYCYAAVINSQNSATCDNTTGNRCNYYYLSVRLDNPGQTETPPEDADCGLTVNYVVTP